METTAFIEALRADIKSQLREEILAELQPEITRRIYSNIFDAKEACQYLKVSIATLRRMVKDGEIPYYRQRGDLRFRQIDLDNHISNKIEEAVTQ